MARVTVEDCLEKVPNRFALVLMVSKRCKQLMKGAEGTVAVRNNKMVVTALREVAAGNVGYEDHLNNQIAIVEIEKDLNK
ncbi:MAG: DNA-directed RNA polymerase subunit omega [Bdellovibrionaceae bacterium]|nr:DNA-directed RNA polymerase subunit omega [Pseudobdellovibrionaceae bacterium]MBX3033456.1 DNA-directed RNA polymerase subunit omega [Pseudobdellovibrionaceae bacterium]